MLQMQNKESWLSIQQALNINGYAILKGVLTEDECELLKHNYATEKYYRKTVIMERYRFGAGEYKYFDYPLPEIITDLREQIYARLAPVANEWMQNLKIDTRYPESFSEMQALCHQHKQYKATPLILKYGQGGHNTLHQDLYGSVYFPMQAVICLSAPGKDFSGGEFVLAQQIPRAQSKAIVLNPGKGDMIIFTTSFRPAHGTKGYYRVHMKHGVSEVHEGERYTLGIIFHDALN